MSYELTGAIHKIKKTEQVTDSFKKRLLVVSVESGPYTEYVPVEFTQDKCENLDAFKEGESVKVNFNLRGREWQGKYFVNLNGWRIERQNLNGEKHEFLNEKKDNPGSGDAGGDLPF